MGARARAVTVDFSDELHARDMLNIYEHVLAQPKAAPAAMPTLAAGRDRGPTVSPTAGSVAASARTRRWHVPGGSDAREIHRGALRAGGAVRILFANHTSAWSGAEVSLMRLVAGLREDHDLRVACPDEGRWPRAVDARGIERLSLPAVDASLRLHPVQTPVGLAPARRRRPCARRAPRGASGLRSSTPTPRGSGSWRGHRAAPRRAAVRRSRPRAPAADSRSGARCARCSSARAGAVAAVSDFTASRFNEGLPRPVATRVYNSIDHARFDPERVAPGPDPRGARARRGTPRCSVRWRRSRRGRARTPRSGRWPTLRARGLDAHLLLVGQVAFGGKGVRFDNHAFLDSLRAARRRARACGDAVHFLGQRDDVPEILRALDLSLLPSWEEPFGLVTVESMALGTPPLVSERRRGARAGGDAVSAGVLAAEAAGAVGRRGAPSCSAIPRALGLMGERWPAGGRSLPRRGPRRRDARDLRARGSAGTPSRPGSRRWPPRPASRAQGGGAMAELIWRLRTAPRAVTAAGPLVGRWSSAAQPRWFSAGR